MSTRHHAFFPPYVARSVPIPETHLYRNVEISALRYPDKPYIIFYDTPISFSRFQRESERIAGFLQKECGVRKGDRVLLYMQNSPQFVLAYYGILRADAVVVPVNPMNLTDELAHYVADSGARVAFAAQDIYERMRPHLGRGLDHIIVGTYSDYLEQATDLAVPDFVAAPRHAFDDAGAIAWRDVLASAHEPGPITAGPDDLCVLPYTSGTTGLPKGCMHTHRSTMYNTISGPVWHGGNQGAVAISVLPMFHATGMQAGMSQPLYTGGTIIVLPRWDRDAAAACVQKYGISTLHLITAMVVDFMANPRLDEYDLSSLRRIGGGGAAMPKAVAAAMRERFGLSYVEGYGMTETISATHMNPAQNAKPQCLGIPAFDVDSRVVDPHTLAELPPGEVGEIIVHGPQVMRGYWNAPEADAQAFVDIDGKRFLRTGDLGATDEDGYFFFVDRLKRMINAAGYKVWPAEVEAMLYQHPAIREACVVAARDAKRGETVKAFVVLHDDFAGKTREADIIDWARDHMAAYKYPRLVSFIDSLPRSGSGKVQWRELQEQENQAAATATPA